MIPLLRRSFQPLLGQITVEGVDIVAGQILYENALLFEKRGNPVVNIGLVAVIRPQRNVPLVILDLLAKVFIERSVGESGALTLRRREAF